MNAYELTSPEGKLVMWYKIKELFEKGYRQAQVCRETGLDKKTVRRYRSMSYDEFKSSDSFKRMYFKLLDPYESQVHLWLDTHNDLSAGQIHDWLREHYADLPEVNSKTVFNFVRYVRAKYNISKPVLSNTRQYNRCEETPYGEYAQADFGEMWMSRDDGRRIKLYFFAMVMSRSRKKYVYFSLAPFTTDLAVYAHEKAFEYYGGKPQKILYDQDAVLLHSENMGDYILTKSFNVFVNQEHYEVIFCRKSDPETKGKIENVVKYVKYNFLRGRTFVCLSQLSEEAARWLSRTANGLPHATTKLVPDEVFVTEKEYLIPYTGEAKMPERAMREYSVHKSNVLSYKGSDYSLPNGTYQGPGTKVWVNLNGDNLEIYNKETGKILVTHKVSYKKGEYVLIHEHRKVHHIKADELETKILEYCCYDELALTWMMNLKNDKPRYYNQNLRMLESNMNNFEVSTLHMVFNKCLDAGMYNAKDLLALCDRIGKRRVIIKNTKDQDRIAKTEVPEKNHISNYSQFFS
jgi:transposase